MIHPDELYHWLGRDAYETVLETYEALPEECALGIVVQEPDHDE